MTKRVTGPKEVRQRRLITPPFWDLAEIRRLAFFERLSLGLEVDLCIDVRGVQRDVPEPSADYVDVDAGAQEIGRRGVADGVRAYALCRQRPHFGDDLEAITLDGGMDPEASDGLAEERAQGVRVRRYRHPRPPATTLYVEESVYV